MKKNKTILSLKEVRKRSKKFYFKLKEHVPLINPCSNVISGIVVKEFKPKLKKAGFSRCSFCYFYDTQEEKDSLRCGTLKCRASERRDGKNVFFCAEIKRHLTLKEKVDLMF